MTHCLLFLGSEKKGVDPHDDLAAASHLPPVDGLDMWPLISGVNSTSPRYELPVDDDTLIQVCGPRIVSYCISRQRSDRGE